MTVPLQFIYFCIFSHVYFYGVLMPLNNISVILQQSVLLVEKIEKIEWRSEKNVCVLLSE